MYKCHIYLDQFRFFPGMFSRWPQNRLICLGRQQAKCFTCKCLTFLRYLKGLAILFCLSLTEIWTFQNTFYQTNRMVKTYRIMYRALPICRVNTWLIFMENKKYITAVAPITNIHEPWALGNKINTTTRQLWILNRIFIGLAFVSWKSTFIRVFK